MSGSSPSAGTDRARMTAEQASVARSVDDVGVAGEPTSGAVDGRHQSLRHASVAADPAAAVEASARGVQEGPAPLLDEAQLEATMRRWKDIQVAFVDEPRRAVQDALPFLHEAKRVTVIEICENGQKEAASHRVDDVVHYLARHRIKAEARVEMRLLGSGADQIIGLAEDEGADLLVTGAYGHSRLNEWIFGGMTHDLLTSSPMCCLMSH